MFSTHLSLVLLLLPLLALRGAHCLDQEDIQGSQESVAAKEKEREQDVKEVMEEKSVPDEIIQDPVEYIKRGDKESEMMEEADSTRRERGGRKLPDRKKETKHRKLKKTDSETDMDHGGGAERKSKGKKPLNIMRLFKGDNDSTTTKEKLEVQSEKNAKGNRKGPPRRKQNKGGNKTNDDEELKPKVKKGRKGNKRGNHKIKGGMLMHDYDATNTIVTTKKQPVFTFATYVLAACGQTYMVTKSSAFLFTTDGGKFSRNCRTNFQSPRGTTIKFYCPVFSLSQNRCKRESLLVIENKKSKWQFCKTDVVDIVTLSNRLMVHHRRRRLARKKCPGAFLCEVSLGAHYGPVTQKPHPIHPVRPPLPYPGPVTQKPYPVPPVKPTPPYPGPHPPPTTTQTTSTSTTVPTTSTTTTIPPTSTTTTTTTTTTEATSTVPTTTTTTTTTTVSPPPTTTSTTTTTTTKTTTNTDYSTTPKTTPKPTYPPIYTEDYFVSSPSITITSLTPAGPITTPKPTYQPIYTEENIVSSPGLTTPSSTPTEPTTTYKPVHPGPIHPGPLPPGPPYPAPLPPGPVSPPGPPVKPPAPIAKPPSPPGGNRPICYGCSPFDITVTRIIGGAEAGVGEFPFQVRLDIGPGIMCSGSLITSDVVLTAAHCYSSGFRTTNVILGDHNIKEQEPFSKTVRAVSVITHRDFDSQSMNNDIALLQLEYPVRYTNYIAPICLSTPEDSFESEVAVASGWGHTQYSGFISNTLQKVALDSITNEECQELYLSKYLISENMLCTYTAEKDACQGDSGGPLVRKEKDGTWVLVGITSFGYKCANYRSPGVFTRVANYKDWISQNLGYPKC